MNSQAIALGGHSVPSRIPIPGLRGDLRLETAGSLFSVFPTMGHKLVFEFKLLLLTLTI